MFKTVLLALDGSELSKSTIETGLMFAKRFDCNVILGFVTWPYMPIETSYALFDVLAVSYDEHKHNRKKYTDQVFAPALALATQLGVSVRPVCVEHAQAWKGLLEIASAEHADLICMASHGHSGLSALLLGSTTQKVLMHSKLPVLVVR